MKDTLYIGTNTKMFKTPGEAAEHVEKLAALTQDLRGPELTLFVIPSFTSIERCVAAAAGQVRIGAQSIGWEERGQFTGEISPLMLKEVGAQLAMIGHSERRHVFHETDEEEEKRVRCAAEHGFTTLLCIGETGEDKAYNCGREMLARQLKIGLHSLAPELARKYLWVAYEPVWAIGVNGVPADEGYADDMHAFIKQTLREIYGEEIGARIPVLYGGSVNPQNAPQLIAKPHINGLFIGRSAWDADNFSAIIHTVYPLWKKRCAQD